jgi:hypothetical protein
MTSLAHSWPTISRSATHRPRTAFVAAARVLPAFARALLALLVALVVLGIAVLIISSIDTQGRLPHPQPLPSSSAGYRDGG